MCKCLQVTQAIAAAGFTMHLQLPAGDLEPSLLWLPAQMQAGPYIVPQQVNIAQWSTGLLLHASIAHHWGWQIATPPAPSTDTTARHCATTPLGNCWLPIGQRLLALLLRTRRWQPGSVRSQSVT